MNVICFTSGPHSQKEAACSLLPLSPCVDWAMGMGIEVGGSFDEAEKDKTPGLASQQDIKNLFHDNLEKSPGLLTMSVSVTAEPIA